MKKIISLLIALILLLQICLPVMSFAVNEEVKEGENTLSTETKTDEKQEVLEDKTEKKEQEEKENEENKTPKEEKVEQEEIKKNEVIQQKEMPELTEKVEQQKNQSINLGSPLKTETDANEIVQLDEKIKSFLVTYGWDENDDGEFSKSELAKVEEIDVSCNNENIDLSGIENMTNLNKLVLMAVKNVTNCDLLSKLTKLKTYEINGYFGTNLEYLKNMQALENLGLNMWGNDSVISNLPILKNLKELSISTNNYNEMVNMNKLSQFEKLESISLQGAYNQNINLEPLATLSNLSKLELKQLNLGNLTGIENIKKLNSLSVYPANSYNLDINAILNLKALESLRIENYKGDISWINSISSLKNLNIEIRQDNGEDITNYLKGINELTVPNIKFFGFVSYDLGEIKPNEEKEITFESFPIIKEMLDPNSKLYYKDLKFESFGNGNTLSVNKENKKIMLTPIESAQRYCDLHFNNNINVELTWTLPKDNEELVFSEKIKEQLKNMGVDADHNGKITKSDLEKQSITNLYLYFNEEEETDLTGIENLEHLNQLSITTDNDIDLSNLKDLSNLESLTLGGSYNNVEGLENLTTLKRLILNKYNSTINSSDITKINKLSNLETLEISGLDSDGTNLLNKLTNLSNLKKLSLSFRNQEKPFDATIINNFTNLEELSLSSIDHSNLAGLENAKKLKSLTIQPLYDSQNKDIDKETLKKMPNLEDLTITITNGNINWLNELQNLKNVSIRLSEFYGENGYETVELNEDFINTINSIKANVKLQGSFGHSLGNIEVGKKLELDLSDNLLINEIKNPNSKLYMPNTRILLFHSGMEGRENNNECTYNQETNKLNIDVNDFGSDAASLYIQNYNNGGNSISIYFTWKGIVKGDTTTDITFKDKNLENALLENYDFDGDKRITENDLINIEYLDLDNKNITDVTGLEKAINAYDIILSNNKIKDATSIIALSNIQTNPGINLTNNQIESVANLKGARFEFIDFSENYIDFSENSANTKIIKDYLNEYYDEIYERDKEYISISKDEFVNGNINSYFKWNTANQKTAKYKKGDVNGDGKVTLIDYGLVLAHVKRTKLLEGDQKQRADVNDDGKVTLIDYGLILAHVKRTKLLF